MLIEPDRVFASSINGYLCENGYNVRHAYDAQAALVAADEARPDMVVCELQLVSHSGIEFLYEFRSYPDWRQVPVVIFSLVPPIEFASSGLGLSRDLAISCYLYKSATTMSMLLRELNFLSERA